MTAIVVGHIGQQYPPPREIITPHAVGHALEAWRLYSEHGRDCEEAMLQALSTQSADEPMLDLLSVTAVLHTLLGPEYQGIADTLQSSLGPGERVSAADISRLTGIPVEDIFIAYLLTAG